MKDVMYFAPTAMSEALKLLDQYGEKATILAGGQISFPRSTTTTLSRMFSYTSEVWDWTTSRKVMGSS